jgi:hypothetical protein
VQNPMALAVLEGQFGPGDTVIANREGDHLKFSRDGVPAGAARGG